MSRPMESPKRILQIAPCIRPYHAAFVEEDDHPTKKSKQEGDKEPTIFFRDVPVFALVQKRSGGTAVLPMIENGDALIPAPCCIGFVGFSCVEEEDENEEMSTWIKQWKEKNRTKKKGDKRLKIEDSSVEDEEEEQEEEEEEDDGDDDSESDDEEEDEEPEGEVHLSGKKR